MQVFGSYFNQEFEIDPIWGAVILSFLCYLTFRKGIGGITKISSILIPLLVGVIIFFGIQKGISFEIKTNEFEYIPGEWVISAILYGSYNTILLIPILFPLKKYITNININIKISTIVVFITILLATILYGIIIENYIEITNIEIPMIYIIGKDNVIYKYLYSVLILVSIYTSAISARIFFFAKCCEKNLSRKSNNYNLFFISSYF